MRAAGVASAAGIALGVTVAIYAAQHHGAPPPDYTLHLPASTVAHGSCLQQTTRWYQQTGQTDLTALAAGEQALLSVQENGGYGIQHASSLLGQAASTAASDPPPACADTAGAWPPMTRSFEAASVHLYMGDTADATPETAVADTDLRIFRAELPQAWFRVFPFTAVPGSPCYAIGATAAHFAHHHRYLLECKSFGKGQRWMLADAVAPPKTRVVYVTVPGPASSAPAAATPAGKTTAGPPDSSCTTLGATGSYYTPANHTLDLLQCQNHTTASGTRRVWRIVGH